MRSNHGRLTSEECFVEDADDSQNDMKDADADSNDNDSKGGDVDKDVDIEDGDDPRDDDYVGNNFDDCCGEDGIGG